MEVLFRNPALNETVMVVDLTLSVPAGIHIYGEGYSQSSAAGAASNTYRVLPGQSQTLKLFIKSEKVRALHHRLQQRLLARGQQRPEQSGKPYSSLRREGGLTGPVQRLAYRPVGTACRSGSHVRAGRGPTGVTARRRSQRQFAVSARTAPRAARI